MSKVSVMSVGGGGVSSISFEKLWEGDVHLTKAVDDISDGALDVSQCRVLMVCYSGSVANEYAAKHFGVARAKVNSESDGDFKLDKGESKQVNITLTMVRQREDTWLLLRSIATYSVV